MKFKNILIIGIILILMGLILIVYTGAVYNHWKNKEHYWENKADYWHYYWIEHKSEFDEHEEAKQNYLTAISKSSEAGSKSASCLWGFVIGTILIFLGIIPILWKRIKLLKQDIKATANNFNN